MKLMEDKQKYIADQQELLRKTLGKLESRKMIIEDQIQSSGVQEFVDLSSILYEKVGEINEQHLTKIIRDKEKPTQDIINCLQVHYIYIYIY